MSSYDLQKDYIEGLIRKDRLQDAHRKMSTAIYNPVDKWVYVKDHTMRTDGAGNIPWDSYPKVMNAKRYTELHALNASGNIDQDKAQYGFVAPEWQDEANQAYDALHARSAGVITSTEFPAITVASIQTELVRLETVATQRFNLLDVVPVFETDKINVIYPEYNDTVKRVRTGYKENDPIETTGWGNFSETNLNLEKSGAGIGFTEEFEMREYRLPIKDILLEGIARDFARVKHERLVALLPNFTDLAGSDWGAFVVTNFHSTNKPSTDLNAARQAINADKIGRANTIVSNEAQWTDYEQNSWTRGLFTPAPVSGRNQNDIITNPTGIPWCERWVLNEDIAANKAFVFDSNAFVRIQGPRVITQFENHNPEQSMTIYKDWFKIHLRKSAWGRELTGI